MRLIDQFMPTADVAECHQAVIRAPPQLVFEIACGMDLWSNPVIRAIFRMRERLLGAKPAPPRIPKGIVEETLALGWGCLARRPGHEIVMGSVTQPWKPDVVFRAVEPGAFAAFSEPDFVKIVWTMECEVLDAGRTMFRTQTRAAGTDQTAKLKFRSYWRFFRFGIVLIRRLLLLELRRECRRRFPRRAG